MLDLTYETINGVGESEGWGMAAQTASWESGAEESRMEERAGLKLPAAESKQKRPEKAPWAMYCRPQKV